MDRKAITDALNNRLYGASLGISIAWPNVNHDTTVPRIEVSYPSADRMGGTVKGGGPVHETGTMLAVVVTAEGVGANAGGDIADDIAARFPEGLRLTISGGVVVITRPPSINGGYTDGPQFRVPVLIEYMASAT